MLTNGSLALACRQNDPHTCAALVRAFAVASSALEAAGREGLRSGVAFPMPPAPLPPPWSNGNPLLALLHAGLDSDNYHGSDIIDPFAEGGAALAALGELFSPDTSPEDGLLPKPTGQRGGAAVVVGGASAVENSRRGSTLLAAARAHRALGDERTAKTIETAITAGSGASRCGPPPREEAPRAAPAGPASPPAGFSGAAATPLLRFSSERRQAGRESHGGAEFEFRFMR